MIVDAGLAGEIAAAIDRGTPPDELGPLVEVVGQLVELTGRFARQVEATEPAGTVNRQAAVALERGALLFQAAVHALHDRRPDLATVNLADGIDTMRTADAALADVLNMLDDPDGDTP